MSITPETLAPENSEHTLFCLGLHSTAWSLQSPFTHNLYFWIIMQNFLPFPFRTHIVLICAPLSLPYSLNNSLYLKYLCGDRKAISLFYSLTHSFQTFITTNYIFPTSSCNTHRGHICLLCCISSVDIFLFVVETWLSHKGQVLQVNLNKGFGFKHPDLKQFAIKQHYKII